MSPTTTRPVVLASIGSNITPHQTTTDMGLSTSDSSASGQVSWLLIGSITAALVIAIVFIISLAVIITVCCLKGRSKKEDQRRQSVISDDEHYYDYVHTFGSTAQTPSCSYSKLHMGGSDHHPAHTVDTMKRNEAYALGNGRLESIEASQNVAYHSALDIL